MSHKNRAYRRRLSRASDARTLRTRDALRRALLALLETKRFDDLSIPEIAATAGIGYATFYRHYPTKEALLDELAAAEVRDLIHLTLPLMDAQRTTAACEALFSYVDKHRGLWSTFLIGGAASVLREELLKVAMGIAAERSQPDAWPPNRLATRLLVSGTIEVLTWYVQEDSPPPKAHLAALLARVVVQPAISRPAAHAVKRSGRRTPARTRA